LVDSAAQLIETARSEPSCISDAVAAAYDRLVDPDRFSRQWIANVDEFVTELERTGGALC
jgi:hypothetical protein